ncbi:MAG TPA: Ig-like domain-containing protein [Candidatus Sulfotelmatobacter sp.]
MRTLLGPCGHSGWTAAFVLLGMTFAVGQSVVVSPTSLSFGNQVLSAPTTAQTVTLKNGLSTSIKISSISTTLTDYSQSTTCPSTLAAGKSCSIFVTFTPTSLGVRSGSLKITDGASNSPQSVALSGTGIAAVTAAPASVSFGNQAIELRSSASTVTVKNNQTIALTINSITPSLSDYTTTSTCPVKTSTLAAGGTCSISIFFTPAAAGVRSGTLTITDDASNSPTVALTGSGVIAASTSPASLLFASQAQGTTTTAQTVTFTNNQSASLIFASITSNSTDFGVTSTCPTAPSALAGVSSCAAAVTFSPKATGTRSGTLSFKDSANNSPQTVSLSGTGAAATLVSLALTPLSASIALGKTQQFAATGTYSDGTSKTLTNSVTWTSTVGTVASINASGLATSLTQGVTTITATSGGVSASATLTVTAAVLVSIAVTPAATSIPLGASQQFTAVGTYSNKSTQNLTSSVAWTSSSAAVASISAGLAVSTGSGTTTITATSGPIKGSTTLTVGAAALVSIALSPSNASIPLGANQQFTATGTYSNGTSQNLTTSVAWSSTTTAVAAINSSGVAVGVEQGSSTITATSANISGSSTLTVTQPTLVSVAVTPASASIPLGSTEQFTATGTYTDGSTQNLTASATWSSSSVSTATVSNSGLASGTGQGSATISAAYGAVTSSATISIGQPILVSLAITPVNASFALGTTLPLKATGTYTDGSTLDITALVAWSSADSAIAIVNDLGLVSGSATGATSISAKSGSTTGTTTLTVNPATLVSIAVTPAIPTIPLGTTKQFSATGIFTDGSSQDLTATVQWSSDTTSVATFSDNSGNPGFASSRGTGSATILATSGSVQGSTMLTVSAAVLTSIAITPDNPSVALGTTQQFVATGTFTDGTTQDLTSSATWSSATQSSVTINSSGLAKGVGVGASDVSATANNISSATLLSVTPAQLVSIAVTPPALTTPLGTVQAFTALGTYTDGTTQDVTQLGHWSSTNADAATVSNTPGSQGLASSMNTGTTTIAIALNTISGSGTLTVDPAALVKISLTPQAPGIPLGTAQQFAASGTYTDGSNQDLTGTVQWDSSSAMVAVVNATGLATSSGSGESTITATYGNVTASTTLKVGQPAIVSLSISPSAATIPLGTTQQFQALATYTNGTSQDLTDSATWGSDAQSVAMISSSGLALGIAMGSANITATSGGVSGSSALAVGPPVLVSLMVTPSASSIPRGTTQQFDAIGTYSNGGTQDLTSSVTWTSSMPAASVSDSGLATAAEIGATTITASSGALSASANLTVAPPTLVSLAITPANSSFALGTTLPLKATGTFTDGGTLDLTASVAWSSADSTVVAVNSHGIAASVSPGSTSVTTTFGLVSGTTTVTVNPASLVSVAVTPAIPTIPLGTTVQFSATGTFTDGSTQDVTATVQWNSDTTSVATIVNSGATRGLATSIQTGVATITAISDSVQGSTTLTVSSAALVSIAVTPGNPSVALGTTQQFVATGTFTDGKTQDLTSTATWSSDTQSSATINSTGLASTAGIGAATISATFSNISGSTLLSVTPAQLVSVSVNPSAVTTPMGTTVAFTAIATYTDNTMQDVTQSGHWSSSNAAAATVSNSPGSQGVATTVGTGTTAIGVGLGGMSGTATLTVTAAALLSITLSPQTPSIPLGAAQQFSASGTYTDGSTQDLTGTVQWNSSSTTVAVVSATGLATSAGIGAATITATFGAVTASTTLTVGQPSIASLSVSPSTATIVMGTAQQFQALATYTNGTTQDVTASAAWSSSVPGVANVTATGLVNSLSPGVTTISAISEAASSGAILTVTPAVPVSLSVTPAAASIAFGAQQQFQAFLTYSDGSILNVTSLVAWSSSSTTIATVNNSGLATGLGAGNTNIYANSNGALIVGSALAVAPPSLISISVTPVNPNLALSSTQQFTATGSLADGSTQDLTGVATWTSSNSTVVGVNNLGLGTALGFGTSTITAASAGITGSNPVTVPVLPTVPSTLFDMTINKANTPWPTDTFSGQRLLGTNTLWGNIETNNKGVIGYTFTSLDKFVTTAQAHGVDLIYTFLGVPSWDSSNSSDASCISWAGSCDPPNDLNSDGTGSNAHWIAFVTNITNHVGTKIRYWEIWNEPNVNGYANSKTWTAAQWVRMAKDARQIILANNPNAVIVSPGIAAGASWLTNFLAAGGGSYVDIIGFHGYANPPETVISLVTPVRAAMATAGLNSLPIWDTEAAWGLNTILPDPNMQAGSVARLYLLNAANGVSHLYWYGWDFGNRGTLWQPTSSTSCGTPNNGGYICLAGIAYAQVYNWTVGAVLSGCSSSGTVWTCGLARPGGYLAEVMWDSSQTCSNGACQTTAFAAPAQFTQYRDLLGNTVTLNGSSTVPLGAEPIILENQPR